MNGSTAAIVVMGVSASGKSTFGAALAAALGCTFVDADGLHPAANVAKMAAGIPLDDADRAPWLDAVGAALAGAAAGPSSRSARAGGVGVVIACSALRRAYRDRLRAAEPAIAFLHLAASEPVLAARAVGRAGHFMPASLLASQLATLEPLGSGERGLTLDATAPLPELVATALAWLRDASR